jgi:hypothetical protein
LGTAVGRLLFACDILTFLAALWLSAGAAEAQTVPTAPTPSVDACAFMDVGLAEACNPVAFAANLIPAHRHPLVAAAVGALRQGDAVDQAYLILPRYLPNLPVQAKTILDKIPANITTLDKVELALLKPRWITDCLQANASCPLGGQVVDGRSVATAISEAMRKVAKDTASAAEGAGCADNNEAICLKLLPSAVETTIELKQWGPLLVQLFQRHSDVCAGHADTTFNDACVYAILRDFGHLAPTWVFGQALSQTSDLSCLDDTTRHAIQDFQTNLWQPLTQSVRAYLLNNPTSPTFLSEPKIASELLTLSDKRAAITARLREAPTKCFQKALDLAKSSVQAAAARLPNQTTPPAKLPINNTPDSCDSSRNWKAGIADVCFNVASNPLAGMRLIYAKRHDADPTRRCHADGDLLFLFRNGDQKTVAVESGIGDITLPHLCDESAPFKLPERPLIAFQPNQDRLQDALNRFFPAPLRVQVDETELDNPDAPELLPSLRIVFIPSVSVSNSVLQGVKATVWAQLLTRGQNSGNVLASGSCRAGRWTKCQRPLSDGTSHSWCRLQGRN